MHLAFHQSARYHMVVRSDTTLRGISGQIRHYSTWYFWSDQTLHYVVSLVRSDTTLRGISGQIRLYTMWYLWSDRRVVGRGEACSPLRNPDWSDRRGIQPRPIYLLAKCLLCHQVKPVEQAKCFFLSSKLTGPPCLMVVSLL